MISTKTQDIRGLVSQAAFPWYHLRQLCRSTFWLQNGKLWVLKMASKQVFFGACICLCRMLEDGEVVIFSLEGGTAKPLRSFHAEATCYQSCIFKVCTVSMAAGCQGGCGRWVQARTGQKHPCADLKVLARGFQRWHQQVILISVAMLNEKRT